MFDYFYKDIVGFLRFAVSAVLLPTRSLLLTFTVIPGWNDHVIPGWNDHVRKHHAGNRDAF